MAANSPFFILGCPRSGTSLLSRMLDAHSEVCVPFETHLYARYWRWRHLYGGLKTRAAQRALLSDFGRVWATNDQSLDLEDAGSRIAGPGFHATAKAIMESLAAAEGKARWGEKTPAHAYMINEIRSGFPGSRFIHIVRDARDTCLSWKRARFGPKHLYVAAQRWQQYIDRVSAGVADLPESRFMEIHYEALLADPERSIRRVCRFLSLEFEDQLLRYYENERVYPTDERNQANLRQPLLRDNAGKWRRELSTRQVLDVEAAAAAGLSRHGYTLSGSAMSLPWYRHVLIVRLLHPLQRLVAMLRNRRGHWLSVVRAVVYVKRRFNTAGT